MEAVTLGDLVSGRDFVTDMDVAKEESGVYGLFFDSGQLLLEQAGYLRFDIDPPFSLGGYDLLYVGATSKQIRVRVLRHLKGNSKASSLRRTVGTLLADSIGLTAYPDPGGHSYFDFGSGEQRLTDWFLDHTRVAHYPAHQPFVTERNILMDLRPPLNINERRTHPFSRHLMELHDHFARRPKIRGRVVNLDDPRYANVTTLRAALFNVSSEHVRNV